MLHDTVWCLLSAWVYKVRQNLFSKPFNAGKFKKSVHTDTFGNWFKNAIPVSSLYTASLTTTAPFPLRPNWLNGKSLSAHEPRMRMVSVGLHSPSQLALMLFLLRLCITLPLHPVFWPVTLLCCNFKDISHLKKTKQVTKLFWGGFQNTLNWDLT